jgi:hypothetical protein
MAVYGFLFIGSFNGSTLDNNTYMTTVDKTMLKELYRKYRISHPNIKL